MKKEDIENITKKAMNKLLSGSHSYLNILRTQFRDSHIKNITTSKSGFFVEFKPGNNSEPLDSKNFHFGDVEAKLKGLNHGMGFVLFVEEGFIHELEGYTYEEKLPESVEDLEIIYLNEERDIENLFH